MLLSDPEMESSILISSDEGATYQKYRLTFYIQSLLFHPRQEDWVLAYSLDQKVNRYCFHSHLITQVPRDKKLLVYSIQILEEIQWHFIIPTKLILSAATYFPFYSLVSLVLTYADKYLSLIGNAIYFFIISQVQEDFLYNFTHLTFKILCEINRKCEIL